MKLYEYEAKEILKKNNIPIPNGGLATSLKEAREVATKLRPPYVVKTQILVAGRGKAGGIQFAQTIDDVENLTAKLLSSEIKGLRVNKIWIEEQIKIKRELYFGVTIDRTHQCYVSVMSPAGGVDIEEVATRTPERIVTKFINPFIGYRSFHAIEGVQKLGYSGKQMLRLASIFSKLYDIAMANDAELIEMNPIVETNDGRFCAADARIIIDDSSLFRHSEFKERLVSNGLSEFSPLEVKASKSGLAYVKLDGNIGIMGNGAGLVMATLDVVQAYGGKPANFLDVGGGASESQITSALDIILSDKSASVVFINILGGITRCDSVARGILRAREKIGFPKPIVIRLVGTNEEEGIKILKEAGIHVLDSMEEAAKMAVKISIGG